MKSPQKKSVPITSCFCRCRYFNTIDTLFSSPNISAKLTFKGVSAHHISWRAFHFNESLVIESKGNQHPPVPRCENPQKNLSSNILLPLPPQIPHHHRLLFSSPKKSAKLTFKGVSPHTYHTQTSNSVHSPLFSAHALNSLKPFVIHFHNPTQMRTGPPRLHPQL